MRCVNVIHEPVWNPEGHPDAWQAIWQYRRKRVLRDARALNLQRDRALLKTITNGPKVRRDGYI